MSDDEVLVILELSKKELRLLGQLLHIHLSADEPHTIGHKLLDNLIQQTDCVHRDPVKHKVSTDDPSARMTKPAWVIPYDEVY